MEWREHLMPAERQEVKVWLERVLHDLVKYLEMMPRSLDWSSLSEDDIECLWESIFETRSFRGEVQSAAQIWESARSTLPSTLQGKLPWLDDVSAHVDALMAIGSQLDEGGFQREELRARIFAVGELLRAQRDV